MPEMDRLSNTSDLLNFTCFKEVRQLRRIRQRLDAVSITTSRNRYHALYASPEKQHSREVDRIVGRLRETLSDTFEDGFEGSPGGVSEMGVRDP